MGKMRTVLSFAVMVGFSVSLLATSKPKRDKAAIDSGLSPDAAYASIVAASSATAPTTSCSDPLLETVTRQVRVGESWNRPEKGSLLLVDAALGLRISKAAARQNNPDDGWRWINSPMIRELYPTTWSVVEQSESKNTDRIRAVAARPLFAVLQAEVRVLPKAASGGESYEGGKLIGKLVMARIDTGTPICVVPFAAASSPRIKFKERGITGTDVDRALLDDFKVQVRTSISNAMKAATPGFKVDVGT